MSIDDKCIALPAADRVAEPCAFAVNGMLAVIGTRELKRAKRSEQDTAALERRLADPRAQETRFALTESPACVRKLHSGYALTAFPYADLPGLIQAPPHTPKPLLALGTALLRRSVCFLSAVDSRSEATRRVDYAGR